MDNFIFITTIKWWWGVVHKNVRHVCSSMIINLW